MQIQPISYLQTSYNSGLNLKQNRIKKQNILQKNDYFQPAFKGYNNVLDTVSKINFKDDKKVESAFEMIFNELILSNKVFKNEEFEKIYELYNKGGFRGLMHELWTANPKKEIEKILEKAEKNSLTLAEINDKPIFEIINLGRHGFWNTLFNSKTAPRDATLTFLNEDKSLLIEFGLDKYGACQICQVRPGETVYTTFHKTTGNRKIVARHPKIGPSETEYYKKDGSDNRLKNFLQGGPVITAMF